MKIKGIKYKKHMGSNPSAWTHYIPKNVTFVVRDFGFETQIDDEIWSSIQKTAWNNYDAYAKASKWINEGGGPIPADLPEETKAVLAALPEIHSIEFEWEEVPRSAYWKKPEGYVRVSHDFKGGKGYLA